MSAIPARPGEIAVRHNVGASRFEALVDGYLSVVDYTFEGEVVVFTHTFVPPELRGRGLAEKLVRAALDDGEVAATARWNLPLPAAAGVRRKTTTSSRATKMQK